MVVWNPRANEIFASALELPPHVFRGWAEALCAYSLQFGYDRQHGGFHYTGPLGKPADQLQKVWWVQAEALVSMLETRQADDNVVPVKLLLERVSECLNHPRATFDPALYSAAH